MKFCSNSFCVYSAVSHISCQSLSPHKKNCKVLHILFHVCECGPKCYYILWLEPSPFVSLICLCKVLSCSNGFFKLVFVQGLIYLMQLCRLHCSSYSYWNVAIAFIPVKGCFFISRMSSFFLLMLLFSDSATYMHRSLAVGQHV